MSMREPCNQIGRPLPSRVDALWALLRGTGLSRDADTYAHAYPSAGVGQADLPVRSERTTGIASALLEAASRAGTGVHDEGFVFACITADLGLWDALADHDPRMADALLAYYTTDVYPAGLVGTVPGLERAESVGRLLKQARQFLYDALPDHPTAAFPYQKDLVFPRERLLKSPPGAGEALRRLWTDPTWRAHAEERLRRMRALQAERRCR